jgi:hypothetical protein
MESAGAWAERTFGGVKLGDKRRTRRVVQMAEAMARYPDGGLGRQMQGWGSQKAAYRLLDAEAVSHANLSEGHWEQTRQAGSVEGKAHLLVQDITEVDYSHHRETEGLGPIGNHQGQGFEVHSTLLVEPEVGEVVGLAHQAVWTRESAAHRKQESRTQRHQRANRQSQVWSKAVEAIGTVPQGSRWVYVGDRESDIFTYFTTIQAQGAHFCIRASQNRRVVSDREARYVLDEGRAAEAMGYQLVRLADGSEATLALSWQALQVRPPTYLKPAPPPLSLWVVRTWEVHPPATRAALEWLLLTDVPVASASDAAERLLWYTRRWLIEEYHRCLKSGCRLEHSQLRHAARLQRLLAFLAILAVRLLQLRTLAQRDPDRPALQVVEPLLVQIVAFKLKTEPTTLTLDRFWRYVAQLGGFPNRKSDAPPGWIRLWRGWLELLALADGVRLAHRLPPLQDVGNP